MTSHRGSQYRNHALGNRRHHPIHHRAIRHKACPQLQHPQGEAPLQSMARFSDKRPRPLLWAGQLVQLSAPGEDSICH